MQETINVTEADHAPTVTISPTVALVGHVDVPKQAELTLAEIEEIDSALHTMLQVQSQSHKRQTLGVVTASTALMIGIVAMVPRLAESDSASFGVRLTMCLLMLYGAGGVMIAGLTRRSYRNKKSITDYIARVSAKAHIGALIRALKIDGKSVKNLAKICLIELLPQLNAGDAELLGERERDILIRELAISPFDKGHRDLTELWSATAERREIAFRVAILKAYEQVGGAKELPLVTRLAEEIPIVPKFAQKFRPGKDLNRKVTELTQAAEECLPYLQLRANEEIASRQLLRASSPDGAVDRTLLRPAAAKLDLPQDQLLRPAEFQ